MPLLGDIFAQSPDLEAFRAAVEKLGGAFPFDTPEMIGLGEAYFQRHPDSSRRRDRDSVLVGYGLVRVCAAERLLRNLSPAGRDFYRAIFLDPSQVGTLAAGRSIDILSAELTAVETEMTAVREAIEGIPKGPIKERFIGGISHLCTVLFLVRMHLRKAGEHP